MSELINIPAKIGYCTFPCHLSNVYNCIGKFIAMRYLMRVNGHRAKLLGLNHLYLEEMGGISNFRAEVEFQGSGHKRVSFNFRCFNQFIVDCWIFLQEMNTGLAFVYTRGMNNIFHLKNKRSFIACDIFWKRQSLPCFLA